MKRLKSISRIKAEEENDESLCIHQARIENTENNYYHFIQEIIQESAHYRFYVPYSFDIEMVPVFCLITSMSGEKKQKPEELLNKLRKLEENKHCANCGEYAKLGHANVCGKI